MFKILYSVIYHHLIPEDPHSQSCECYILAVDGIPCRIITWCKQRRQATPGVIELCLLRLAIRNKQGSVLPQVLNAWGRKTEKRQSMLTAKSFLQKQIACARNSKKGWQRGCSREEVESNRLENVGIYDIHVLWEHAVHGLADLPATATARVEHTIAASGTAWPKALFAYV